MLILKQFTDLFFENKWKKKKTAHEVKLKVRTVFMIWIISETNKNRHYFQLNKIKSVQKPPSLEAYSKNERNVAVWRWAAATLLGY